MREELKIKGFHFYPKKGEDPPGLKTFQVLVINGSKVAYFSDSDAAQMVAYGLSMWIRIGRILEALQNSYFAWNDFDG